MRATLDIKVINDPNGENSRTNFYTNGRIEIVINQAGDLNVINRYKDAVFANKTREMLSSKHGLTSLLAHEIGHAVAHIMQHPSHSYLVSTLDPMSAEHIAWDIADETGLKVDPRVKETALETYTRSLKGDLIDEAL